MNALASAGISLDQVYTFVLVLARCAGTLFLMPIFSGSQIPNPIKMGLGFMIAFCISQALHQSIPFQGFGIFVLALLTQLAIGLIFGYCSNLVFVGIQYAGEIVDTQVGFAITNIINPTTNTAISVLGQIQVIVATIIYLATNTHYLVFEALADSFRLVPLPFINPQPGLLANVSVLFSGALMIVFRIAIPISITLLITNVAMGFFARVAPQMNVFLIGFPAQLGIGMLVFFLALPLMGLVLPNVFSDELRQSELALRYLTLRH